MKRAILCTLIAAALLLSACTRASESTVRAPDAGAPLTLCLGAGPAALDPARTENGVGATYVVNLFAGLTGYRAGGDGKAELTPELCAALPEPESLPDGRVQYVFTLRDGLTWSDGTPLTAADFVYAWTRASTLSDAAAPYLFACIDGYGTGRLNVTASADGRTLTVVLAEAMPTFCSCAPSRRMHPCPPARRTPRAGRQTARPLSPAGRTRSPRGRPRASRIRKIPPIGTRTTSRLRRCASSFRATPTLRRPPSSRANTRSAGPYRMTRSTTCVQITRPSCAPSASSARTASAFP